jgi:hypothetical protein
VVKTGKRGWSADAHGSKLRQWAVEKNNWQGPRARAVIVSDDGRFWYVSGDGVDEEVSAER